MSATLTVVPAGNPAGFTPSSLPPANSTRVPSGSDSSRVSSKSRETGNGWERFAAKAEGSDGKKIVGCLELARGVALERQQRVIMGHPVAVVGHANHALPALLDFDAHRLAAGIERVLKQLLQDRKSTRL